MYGGKQFSSTVVNGLSNVAGFMLKCRLCATANVKSVPSRKHKCRINWTCSAKAMYPAMACQMLKNVEDEGVKVLNLIIHVPFYGKFNSKSNDCLFSLHSNPVNSFVLMNNITKKN